MKVLVFGGTHGNEWTGITVVTKYAEHFKQKYPELRLEFILANPEAARLNKRFKDEDLNRAFQYLNESRPESYEHARAKEIKEMIDAEPCFVIDLHTTTSNMGSTLIICQYNQLNLRVAKVLSDKIPDCRIIGSPDPEKKYLGSQSDLGVMIEVGPVPNGVIEAKSLARTLSTLDALLSELQSTRGPTSGEVEIFEETENVFYPPNSYVHEGLQGRDFTKLRGSYQAFRTFAGDEILLICENELYPIFINEAAYYPQKLAYILCRKTMLTF